MKAAILVNGVPASGKSMVATALARETGWPVLTLDTIKESLFDQLGAGDRDYNRKLGKASFDTIFSLIRDFPEGSVVLADAWYGFQPRDFTLPHIARAGLTAIVEIWCHARPAVIADRYIARIGKRPKNHPGMEYVPELRALAERAKPLSEFSLITVDTEQPLDSAALAANVRSALGFP